MLNRRHIRAKVMQSIYAMHLSNSDDLEKQEKFLLFSLDNIQDLYLTMLSIFTTIQKNEAILIEKSSKKHLATQEEKNPNLKFVNNLLIKFLNDNNSLNIAIEERKIDYWNLHSEYIQILTDEIKKSHLYSEYMSKNGNDFQEDKNFIENIFEQIIAPNEKLYEFIEDNRLTWIDDLPTVNTLIAKQLAAIKSINDTSFKVPKIYKDVEDKEYVSHLFRKTVLNESEIEKEYANKTPNWDTSRIAEIDTIILKMAICEFLKFPSIPTKVTINEYLEIAKEYSTPKSSIFINGILDNLVKEFQANGRLLKTGRGLM